MGAGASAAKDKETMGSALEALGAKVKAGDDADKAKLSAELRNMADALKGRYNVLMDQPAEPKAKVAVV
jgi:hypothetical protein